MKGINLFTAIFFLTLLACSRYNTQKYLNEEYRAIVDLIPEMVMSDYMLKNNFYVTDTPVLFLINDWYGTIDVSEYSELIPEIKKILKPFYDGTLPDRLFPQKIETEFSKIKIELLEKNKFELDSESGLSEIIKRNKNIFGYLSVSRIHFDSKYKKAYVEFSFFCGESCVWHSMLEIRKENGKWKRYKEIYGGIA